MLDLIHEAQRAERNPALKVLIFTEFVPTQEMLRRFLEDRGFPVALLNGSMDLDERQRAQRQFAGPAQVLISTDAGGEGLNLQFCHVVVNYDMPWNPMRIEQRIGRVDRIGQSYTVRAHNLVLADTVEHRVREVLEEKLAIIRSEFGVDKTGDVLDSGEFGALFEDIYLAGVIQPDQVENAIDRALHEIREQAAVQVRSVLGDVGTLDATAAQRMIHHPLPAWIERMVVHYLRAGEGGAQRTARGWLLDWPGGQPQPNVVFRQQEAVTGDETLLTLEDARLRYLVEDLEIWTTATPIPMVQLQGLPAGVAGLWSLWQITLSAHQWRRQRFLPLFMHEDGRSLAPTARRVWDLLLTNHPVVLGEWASDATLSLEQDARRHAENQGQAIYQELQEEHRRFVARLDEKTAYAFAARRRACTRIGLPEVRAHRLAVLQQEESAWQIELALHRAATAALQPLLFMRLEKSG